MTKPFKKRSRLRAKQRKQLPRHRYETWQNYRVSVIRAPNGRFVNWHRVRYGRPRKEVQPSRKPSARAYARRETPARQYARKRLAEMPRGKRVAVYGSKDGKHKRWVITGTGKQQYKAISRVAIVHPPKRQFQTVDAEDLLDDPQDYIGGYWDDHPRVES